MIRRHGLVEKLIIFFVILVVSVLTLTGVSAYLSQMSIYREQSERRLQNTLIYLAELMSADGQDFLAYQRLSIALKDEINIPFDFDGDYHDAKTSFYDSFNREYPGKTPGKDIAYEDMSRNLQILYVTYRQEYWLHIVMSTSKNFNVTYIYYMVPTGEKDHMYYIFDPVPDSKVVDGKEYIVLDVDIYEPLSEHKHMWEAWEKGEFTPGYDYFDNEYGQTYGCYYPLWIDGIKAGVIGADIEIEHVNNAILYSAIKQTLWMAALMIVFGGILSFVIGAKYIKRLLELKDDVVYFTETRDESVVDRVNTRIKGNDEIHDLAVQISIMISSISIYMNSLIEKNRQLTEAQNKIRAANELANKDALTGIRNKTSYDDEVRKIEDRIVNEKFDRFGIAMVDLNYLKVINDNFGHEKGNISIKKICMIVCKNFTHSPVFRIGGDEFVVILENEDYDNAIELVRKFKKTLNEISGDDSLEPWEKVSAAIGWTMFDPETDEGVQSVFKRADDLMYEDKKAMKAARE